MLSDRSYMRDDDSGRRTSALTWILCAIAAAFILQNVVTRLFRAGPLIESLAALTPPDLASGQGWISAAETLVRLFTYGFIHNQEYLIHVIAIGLALYFLGRELLPLIGSRRLVGLFFATLAGGGLFWTAVHWGHGGILMGATPAVMGLLAVFALLLPDREITLLLLFIPVTVKPKYVALVVLLFDLFGCIFYELMGAVAPIALAPSAHLGGMAVGWLYWRFFHDTTPWRRLSGRPAIELPKWMKRTPPGSPTIPPQTVNVANREHLRAEVDRILDKINSQGFGALSPEEKRLLDDAKDLLSRR